mgnify:CR=1 FL=1
MVDWANAHAAELFNTLQPVCPRIPSPATWRRLLIHIDLTALEQQVAAFIESMPAADSGAWHTEHLAPARPPAVSVASMPAPSAVCVVSL